MPDADPLNAAGEQTAECWCTAPGQPALCAGCGHTFAAHYQDYGGDDGCSAREAAGEAWVRCQCNGFTRLWRQTHAHPG